jgi:transcriptional regulator of acetoin/glycerol metabolism
VVQLEKEILLSWKRCIKKDISARLSSPCLVFQRETVLQNDDNSFLITIFERAAECISRFITTDHILFLTDPDGILLAKTGTKKNLSILSRSGIETGSSFSEESCGTNAISLAIKLKHPVYLSPEQHFCDFFKSWHCYAVPLAVGGMIKGYLDVSTIEQAVKKELIAITQLLAEKIVNEYGAMGFSKMGEEIKLSYQQLIVLQLISQGLTTKAIALETGISVNTVKYHKKILFRRLGVQSTGEAVAKAINAGLI